MGNSVSNVTEVSNNHREFLLKLEKTDPQFFIDQKNNKKNFFWLSNPNPDKIQENQLQWTPYSIEDNLYIEYCFQQYLRSTPIIAEIGDYIIDFKRWLQYHKVDTWKQRRVVRTTIDKLKFIYRNGRFSYSEFMNNYNPIYINKISYKKQMTNKFGNFEIVSRSSNISKEIHKKYSYMLFYVISGKDTKFLILNEFKNNLSFNLRDYDEDFKRLKKKLIMEFDLYADSIKQIQYIQK